MPRGHRTRLPLLLGLLLMLGSAHADYEVELILFEHVGAVERPGERWHPDITIPRLGNAVDLEPDDTLLGSLVRELPSGFERIDSDDFRLHNESRRLTNSRSYRVLRHVAWRQPATEPAEAVSLRLRAGEPMTIDVPTREPGPLGQPIRIEEILAQAMAADTPKVLLPELDEDGALRVLPSTRRFTLYPLDGTVRVEVRRYLHIHTDLYYTAPVDWTEAPDEYLRARPTTRLRGGADDNGEASDRPLIDAAATGRDGRPVLSFPVQQHRRMRSGELHYIDHPVIGILVLASRTED